jgi:hypothetical protein
MAIPREQQVRSESCRSPTAAFLKAQFKSFATGQRSFITVSIVPIADGHDLEELTFVVSTRQVRAVIQFSGSDFPIGGHLNPMISRIYARHEQQAPVARCLTTRRSG